jgi:hypothetical protein
MLRPAQQCLICNCIAARARDEFHLAAIVQNLKTMVLFYPAGARRSSKAV